MYIYVCYMLVSSWKISVSDVFLVCCNAFKLAAQVALNSHTKISWAKSRKITQIHISKLSFLYICFFGYSPIMYLCACVCKVRLLGKFYEFWVYLKEEIEQAASGQQQPVGDHSQLFVLFIYLFICTYEYTASAASATYTAIGPCTALNKLMLLCARFTINVFDISSS